MYTKYMSVCNCLYCFDWSLLFICTCTHFHMYKTCTCCVQCLCLSYMRTRLCACICTITLTLYLACANDTYILCSLSVLNIVCILISCLHIYTHMKISSWYVLCYFMNMPTPIHIYACCVYCYMYVCSCIIWLPVPVACAIVCCSWYDPHWTD